MHFGINIHQTFFFGGGQAGEGKGTVLITGFHTFKWTVKEKKKGYRLKPK